MSSREINDMPIKPALLPIRKYCGKADSRTPHQFVREFEMSSLYTGVDHTDIRNFYMVLGDQFSFYVPTFNSYSSFKEIKSCFVDLTWTSAEKQKKLDAIKKEKFDFHGRESWKEYIFRTYLFICDYGASDMSKTDFCIIMNKKLLEVGKSDSLTFEELVERSAYARDISTSIQVTYDDNNGKTIKRVFYHGLTSLTKILYLLPDDESQNQSKSKPVSIEKEKVSEVDRHTDSKLESQPKEIQEIRPSDPEPVIRQELKQEVIFCRCGLQGSFQEPLLLSVFYFILYFLLLHFWNFGNNSDTSMMKPPQN